MLVLGAGDIATTSGAVEVFGATVTTVARRARDGVRTIDELPALLPDTDVVVVALPAHRRPRGWSTPSSSRACPTARCWSTSRAARIVDTDALLAELSAGRLRAFLDVTDPEPLPADHPLWDAPNLLLTPHVGGGTPGWERRAYRAGARRRSQRFVAGEPLENVVSDGY